MQSEIGRTIAMFASSRATFPILESTNVLRLTMLG